MEKSVGIIPARYGSSRFPGKPLADIGGKTMIQRVYEQCLKSKLDAVVVATDHEKIAQTVRDFGGKVILTEASIPSGTDRCREALNQIDHKPGFIVNIQGDEPFIDPRQINEVLEILEGAETEIATLIIEAESWNEINNPNRVKVVKADDGRALYFSRHSIPYPRNKEGLKPSDYYIHLGIYGFKRKALMETGKMDVSLLEAAEGLEQLRWLQGGKRIYTRLTKTRGDSVDTPEDLEAIKKKYLL